jgi:hypothetical protein
MAPLAFYDALAASASVFIGILTALLISNLSTMTTARGRIARRITAIDARIESLASRRDRLRENLDRIEEVWETREQQDAQESVEGFIDRHVGSDFITPIENINFQVLMEELADYLECEVEDLNQYHEDALQNQMAEIESELVVAVVEAIISDYEDMPRGELYDLEWEEFRNSFKDQLGITNLDERTQRKLRSEYDRITPDADPDGLFGQLSPGTLSSIAGTDPLLNTPVPTPSSPEIQAAKMQREDQQRIHEENQYHRDKNQHVRTETEMDALQTERNQLVTRFESLDPAQLRNAIRTSVGTILASVLFPLFIHLLHVLGWVLRVPERWTVLEPIAVFLLWIGGLAWVFLHIRGEITEDTVDVLDDPPEV